MGEEQDSLLNEEDVCQLRTAGQWIAYKFFTAQSSTLSILGSSLIIFMVYRRGRAGLAKFQNRLLLPMSVFDIIGSIGWAFSTTPIPRGSTCTYGAIGNEATCITQGFMISLGLIVPMYNAMLCIYYLLVVKYNVRDEVIAKYEPFIHFICICPPISCTILAAANDLLNNNALICWIQERDHYDPNLETDHERSIVLSGIYFTVMIIGILDLLTIGYCMISIYKFVKNQEVKMKTYQFQRPDSNSLSSAAENRSMRSNQSSRLSNDVVDTKKQAFLYVGSFILTHSFSSICLALAVLKIKQPYTLMLLQGITTPLQGFWNFLAYIRPRFNIISREHSEKSIFSKLYITVFHIPDPPRQGRRRRRRTQTRRGELSRSNVMTTRNTRNRENESSNGGGAAAIYHTINNDVTSSKHENYKPKVLTKGPNHLNESDQPQTHSELQQYHMIDHPYHDEGPANHGHDIDDEVLEMRQHDVNQNGAVGGSDLHMISDDDEEEQQSGQNIDDRAAPSDFLEAVTLSLVVAEDILPRRSSHGNRNKRKRRASMVERQPVELDSEYRTSCLTSYLEENKKKSSNDEDILSRNFHQKRRHSCSILSEIEMESVRNLK